MIDLLVSLLEEHGEEIVTGIGVGIGAVAAWIGGYYVVKGGIQWLKEHCCYNVVKSWLLKYNQNRKIVKIVSTIVFAADTTKRLLTIYAKDRNGEKKEITEKFMSLDECQELKEGKENVLVDSEEDILKMMNGFNDERFLGNDERKKENHEIVITVSSS